MPILHNRPLSSLPIRSSPRVVSPEAAPGDDPNPTEAGRSPSSWPLPPRGWRWRPRPAAKGRGDGAAPMDSPSRGGGDLQGWRRWTEGLVVVAFGYITRIMAGDAVVWRILAGRKGGSGIRQRWLGTWSRGGGIEARPGFPGGQQPSVSASWACVAAIPPAAGLHRPGWRRKMDRGSQPWRRRGGRPFRLSWWWS